MFYWDERKKEVLHVLCSTSFLNLCPLGGRDGLACEDSFGFKAESPHYTYCLRCTPRRGDYNFYLYAYDKDAQREHALLKGRKEPEKQKTAKPKIKRNEMER